MFVSLILPDLYPLAMITDNIPQQSQNYHWRQPTFMYANIGHKWKLLIPPSLQYLPILCCPVALSNNSWFINYVSIGMYRKSLICNKRRVSAVYVVVASNDLQYLQMCKRVHLNIINNPPNWFYCIVYTANTCQTV